MNFARQMRIAELLTIIDKAREEIDDLERLNSFESQPKHCHHVWSAEDPMTGRSWCRRCGDTSMGSCQ